jgi:hypothetical protein
MDPVWNHPKTSPIVASLDMSIHKSLAGRHKQAHTLDQTGKNTASLGDVGPEIITPKTLTTIHRSLRWITQSSAAFVQQVIGTKQPMVV